VLPEWHFSPLGVVLAVKGGLNFGAGVGQECGSINGLILTESWEPYKNSKITLTINQNDIFNAWNAILHHSPHGSASVIWL